MKCPKCGIEYEGSICPICGESSTLSFKKRSNRKIKILGTVAFVFAALLVISGTALVAIKADRTILETVPVQNQSTSSLSLSVSSNQKGDASFNVVLESAEDYINALKETGLPIGRITVWDEKTDLNGLLGRPNQYIAKADFEDTRLEQFSTNLNGGTVEVFANEQDCEARYSYLEAMSDPSLGVIGVNEYMYKGERVILRVSFDFTPSEAKEYEDAFNSLIQ